MISSTKWLDRELLTYRIQYKPGQQQAEAATAAAAAAAAEAGAYVYKVTSK